MRTTKMNKNQCDSFVWVERMRSGALATQNKDKHITNNRDNYSYLAFARTIITVTPTLCHDKD